MVLNEFSSWRVTFVSSENDSRGNIFVNSENDAMFLRFPCSFVMVISWWFDLNNPYLAERQDCVQQIPGL